MRAERLARIFALSGFLLVPGDVWAQSATTAGIAGVVRDATGAVLPGVTVEAASPALAALTVGVSVTTGTGNSGQDVGGNKGEQRAGLSIHGSDPNDGRFLYDGMRFNMMSVNGGGPSKHYYVDQNDVQEMVLETSG